MFNASTSLLEEHYPPVQKKKWDYGYDDTENSTDAIILTSGMY